MSNFFNEISTLSGLPFDLISGGYKLINFGGNAVYIEGINKINSFSECRVSARIGKKIIEITGEDLKIKMMSKNDVIIVGKISAVSVD